MMSSRDQSQSRISKPEMFPEILETTRHVYAFSFRVFDLIIIQFLYQCNFFFMLIKEVNLNVLVIMHVYCEY